MLIDSLVVFKPRCIYVLPSDFTVIGVIVLLWLFLHIKKAHLTISDSGSTIVDCSNLRTSIFKHNVALFDRKFEA